MSAFSRGSVPHVRHAAAAVIRPSAYPGPRFSQDRRCAATVQWVDQQYGTPWHRGRGDSDDEDLLRVRR